MRKRVWVPVLALVVLLAGGAAALALGWRALNAPLAIAGDVAWIEVGNGVPLRRVATQLGERGLLRYPFILTAYARITGGATRIRAGEYQVPVGTTPLSLLSK